jgi:hypothetical protein
MSQKGQKQTLHWRAVDVRFTPKADIGRRHLDVRWLPLSDIAQISDSGTSTDCIDDLSEPGTDE